MEQKKETEMCRNVAEHPCYEYLRDEGEEVERVENVVSLSSLLSNMPT